MRLQRKFKKINSIRWVRIVRPVRPSRPRPPHHLLGSAHIGNFKVEFAFHDGAIEWRIIGILRSNLNEFEINNNEIGI